MERNEVVNSSIAPKARGPRGDRLDSSRRRQRCRAIERLEPRRLLSTITWDGGPTGQGIVWSDPVNWVGDVVPGNSDDAVIPIVGPGFVSIQDPVAVRSVSCSAALSV